MKWGEREGFLGGAADIMVGGRDGDAGIEVGSEVCVVEA